jgi:adenosine deaminase
MEFAAKRKLDDLPLDDPEKFRKFVQMTADDPLDFLTFLSKFRADWYSTLEDPKRLAREAVEDAAKENVIYMELRFSAEHFTRKSGFSVEAAIEAVIEGAKEAADKVGMQLAFLLTMGREKMTPDQMIAQIKRSQKYLEYGVVGIDLAGDELHYAPGPFSKVFRGIHERTGFHATIHAGEAGGAENVRIAVEELDAVRIGHGVHAIDDPAVVDLLVERGVALEQCLTSNLQTGTVSSIEEHPFQQFYRKGVLVTLNTDDPQIQQSDLADDYRYVVDKFSMTLADLEKINLNSINVAFLPEDQRKALARRYSELFAKAVKKG